MRYFILMLGICFLLTGCRPDYEQALDNMQATQRLVSAVVHPNYDAIQEAATEGANMNRIWVNGAFTSPILCVWQTTPRPLFLEQMLKNGSDVNYADRNGNTLLMYASGYEPQYSFVATTFSVVDYCKLFLQYGADVTRENKDGLTALDFAVRCFGTEETVDLLLKNGAVVTPQVLRNAFYYPDSYTDYVKLHRLFASVEPSQANTIIPPILVAAIAGNSAAVQQYANNDPTLSEEEQLQTLCHAAAFCNADTVRLLLTDGFGTIQTIDAADNTLLQIAATQNNTDVMNFLLNQGAWDTESRDAALRTAIRNNSTEACRLLLDSGTPVITGTVSIWEVFDNIMDGASENGNVEITQMLIQHGYPVNDTTAWYAMKKAAQTGQTAIIQYWVSLGYDPDYRADNTNGDSSVLQDACWAEQIETVQYLLDIGCDVNAPQKCLPMAVETGNIALVKLLLDHGAAVDESTVFDDGSAERTPKEGAELYGFGEILELLEQYQHES